MGSRLWGGALRDDTKNGLRRRLEDIGQCYFVLLQVYCLSSSLKEVFLARHAIFLGNQMYKMIGASRHVFTNCQDLSFLYSGHGEFLFKV